MASQVVQISPIGAVKFAQNRRSKNIKVSVKSDKSVLVSYPFYVSGKEALQFILKNQDWIIGQQNKMEGRQTRILPNTEIKTKIHTVKFLKGEEFDVVQNNMELQFIVPNFDTEEARNFLAANLSEVYRFEAKRLLPTRLQQLAEKHGFSYNKVTIRDNRRNWGSCSSKNNISLNLQMMKLPVELIDHILLHELVHTEIKNHSKDFWERLDEVSNGRAKELSKAVKQYSTSPL